MKDIIVVLTVRGLSQMLTEGGSQAWRLDAERAKKCSYVVCVQNEKGNSDLGEPEAEHHHAFMVGHISDVVPSQEKGSEDRWMIKMDKYAEIDIANQWDGNRNPVTYRNLESMGIDLDKLDFKPMPEIVQPSIEPV